MVLRAIRARKALRSVVNRTSGLAPDAILCFVTLKDEADRLPYFLAHHRALGVDHFLIVDNDSKDGSAAYLAQQTDVSVWHTSESYRAARFGVHWIGWLLWRYGAGHWCLTLDCDELLIYPKHDERSLRDLTQTLDKRGLRSFRTLMIELFAKGQVGAQAYQSGQHPAEVLPYFDGDEYISWVHPELHAKVTKGGVRARVFFPDAVAERAPHLNKTPLVRWHRSYAYLDSTHTLLPRALNRNYDEDMITGALLHSKFLPSVLTKSADPSHRAEHFTNPSAYDSYYDALLDAPDMWNETAQRYSGWEQLAELGLIRRGNW